LGQSEKKEKIKISEFRLKGKKSRKSSANTSHHFKSGLFNDAISHSPGETLMMGPIAPSELMEFHWSGVSLKLHKGFKTVVKECYGEANRGEITAIVGPSKSGKTFLLKLLAQKIPLILGKKKGNFFINQTKFKLNYLKASSVFVRGEDIYHDIFTNKELLDFASLLRVSGPMSHRRNVVEGIMNEWKMQDHSSYKVQDYEYYGVSPLEKRKISIALELLDNPGIIFIDDLFGDRHGEDRMAQFELLAMLKREAA
jgi:ABC-type multidrug transport system ATPase subunit